MCIEAFGYQGKELEEIMNNLKGVSADEYLDAAWEIPEKRFKDLGYISQQQVIDDYNDAFVYLVSAEFNEKEAHTVILSSMYKADKDHFNKSLKALIDTAVVTRKLSYSDSSVTGDISPSHATNDSVMDTNPISHTVIAREISQETVNNGAQLLVQYNRANNFQEALKMAQQIYNDICQDNTCAHVDFINDMYEKKINDLIQGDRGVTFSRR